MPSDSYSFLDVAVLDAVRQRFAAGDAIAILSADLEQVIWANGPGAAVLGYADIEEVIGASARLPLVARRQIMATGGFPDIGSDRAILVRLASGISSRAVGFLASAVTMPDGEKAIMLAVPAAQAGSRSAAEIAERAIGGFAEDGHFIALLDGTGGIEAASNDFDTLGISQETLAALVADVAGTSDRIVKRLVPGGDAFYPAGLARLTDDPARHLLVVVDDREAAEEGPADSRPAAGEAASKADAGADAGDSARPIEAKGGEAGVGEPPADAAAEVASGPPAATETGAVPPSAQSRRTADHMEGEHDHWYFNADEKTAPKRQPAESAPPPEAREQESAAGPDETAAVRESAVASAEPDAGESNPDRGAAPVRFVWRTDAEGRFSMLSPEFAAVVGERAAGVIGRRFEDVSAAFRLDPSGEVAGLLERRDTWSGRSVLWPVAGTELKIPVDLAALPIYGRGRTFEGFRGFGVARAGEAVADPEKIGMTLLPEEPAAAAPQETPSPQEPEAPKKADPFKGEVPALTIVPKPERRFADKVIRLAEHRPPASDRSLSNVERSAFREIGERLKKESAPGEDQGQAEPATQEKTPEPEPGMAGTAQTAIADKKSNAAADGGVDAGSEPGLEDDQATEIADTLPTPPAAAALGPATEPGRLSSGGSLLSLIQQDGNDTEDEAVNVTAAEASADTDAALAEPEDAEEQADLARLDGAPANDAEPPMDARGAEETGGEDSRPRAEAERTEPAADAMPAAAPVEPAHAETAVAPAPREAPPLRSEGYLPSAFSAGDERTPDTSILGKLPVPLLIHSGDVLHYANDEFLDLTGFETLADLEEAGGLGALFADPYAEDGAPDETGRTLKLKTRDGLEFPIEAILRSVPWRGGKALMLVVRRTGEDETRPADAPQAATPAAANDQVQPDISELKARIAEMRTIIDTATDGVVLIARDGNIRSISRPAEALFSFDSDEVAGKPFASLFAIESQRAARDYLAGLSEPGVASLLNDGREVIGREAQGRFIPLFMTIGRLPNDSGFCAVVRDITQWKRAEEDLTQARAVAERASSQKTEFLARISHEIRTPLNAIIGFSELMVDEKFGPVANDRYRDYLRDINRSGNHVLDLVNDLLDISKIEAGQQEMEYEAVSLNDTLAETVAMMQPQANRERVIIRSSFASKLPDVVADLRSVRQIALNILSNAVRYTQAGGQVIVSTAYELSGDVVMRVRDTGIGMSQAEIEQALKPFKQINTLKRGRGDGTGLGLPLTKAMVEANRARFTINSTPGEGTLVEIAFPSTRVLAE